MSYHLFFIKLCIFILIATGDATDFKQCKIHIIDQLTRNGTIPLDTNATVVAPGFNDPVFHGVIHGLKPGIERPLVVTEAGCNEQCGTGPDFNDTYQIIQILTTWVLPVLALMGQLPYEALSKRKRKNFEAFINWVGSPAAALTTTIWNMQMIGRLAHLCNMAHGDPLPRDVYYILSCINQYLYPRGEAGVYVDRDKALLAGILFPFVNESQLPPQARHQLKDLTAALAKQLRLQRRRGVYPLSLSVILFLAAFIISIVLAFDQLGDNTTAHSLALGLLLSWMPIMVVASVTDRNPLSSSRCRVLIERWLYNVHAILLKEGNPTDTDDQADADEQTQQEHANRALMWRDEDTTAFSIGEYVGQGRKLRYCGVTDTILDMITNSDGRLTFENGAVIPQDSDATTFQTNLKKRPLAWFLTCFLSQMLIIIPFATAFTVSYRTPTIGLGCRSLSYLVWFLLSSLTWFALLFVQEPRKTRIFAWIPSTLSVVALVVIIAAQVSGGFNTCACKASKFGLTALGGYVDFENGEYYQQAYNVKIVWGFAAAIGLLSTSSAIAWFVRRWNRDSILWRVMEDGAPRMGDDINLYWLA